MTCGRCGAQVKTRVTVELQGARLAVCPPCAQILIAKLAGVTLGTAHEPR